MVFDKTWIIPIVSVVGGLLGTIVGGYISHFLTLRREKQKHLQERALRDDVFKQELTFIGIELTCLLEGFAVRCAKVSEDGGVYHQHTNEFEKAVNEPLLNLKIIEGNWKVLPSDIMYEIRSLPLQQSEAAMRINNAWIHEEHPTHPSWFTTRSLEYARLGLSAARLAEEIRQLCALPVSRLNAEDFLPVPVMNRVIEEIEENRRKWALKRAQRLAEKAAATK